MIKKQESKPHLTKEQKDRKKQIIKLVGHDYSDIVEHLTKRMETLNKQNY